MRREWSHHRSDVRRVEITARVAAIGLVVSLSAVTGSGRGNLVSLGALIAVAIVGALPVRSPDVRHWRPVAEASLVGLIIATTSPYDPALVPYLVVPALSAGLAGGWRWPVITASAGWIALLMRGVIQGHEQLVGQFLVDAAQWSLLALAVGLLAAWARRIQTQRATDSETYGQAARLLTQLRDVARQLSGGLDTMALAQQTMQHLRPHLSYDSAAVFSVAPNGGVTLVAHEGDDAAQWSPDVRSPGSIWSATLVDGTPSFGVTPHTPVPRYAVLLPIKMTEVVGLVRLERASSPYTSEEVQEARQVLHEAAIRLDAAALFDELRAIATTEERKRLAREIHDGIAQELASLGYAIDDLTARANSESGDQVISGLLGLRAELSGVISDLRLSIFDLRSEVGPANSLTTCLANNARALGAASGLTVHLDLSETPQRLTVQTEAELLRIAQEAMTNARRHAHAANLWVSCRVDPPHAVLRVEDDGRGLTTGRQDSFGLDIMRERADRIGASLAVTERLGGGGVVIEVVVGPVEQPTEGSGDRAHHGVARR